MCVGVSSLHPCVEVELVRAWVLLTNVSLCCTTSLLARQEAPCVCGSMVSFSLENFTKIFGWGMQLLVSFIFHDLPSLHPSSFQRNDFLHLFHLFFGMHCNINGGKPPGKKTARCRFKHRALVFRAVIQRLPFETVCRFTEFT